MAIAGAALTTPFSVSVTGLTAFTAYTYLLDKGDAATPGACATLGTAAVGDTSFTDVRLTDAATTVTYTATGIKTAVLRIYTATDCAAGSAPAAGATIFAVGTVTIPVGSEPL